MTDKKTTPANQGNKSELVFTKKKLSVVIDQHCNCGGGLYPDDGNNRHLRFQKNATRPYGGAVRFWIRSLCHFKKVSLRDGLFTGLYFGCN